MIALILIFGLAQLPSPLFHPPAMATAMSPEPPSNVTLSHVANGILVSWDDNSDDEDGFMIERKEYMDTTSIWIPYDVVDADVTHYLDTSPVMYEQCEYRVRATAVGGVGFSLASPPASIPCAPTSVTDEAMVSGTRIWPNPATETFAIEAAHGRSVTLFDMTGRIVLHTPVQSHKETIGIGHLPNGIYVVAVEMRDGSVIRQRLVRQ